MTASMNELERDIRDHRERLGQTLSELKHRARAVRSADGALAALHSPGEPHPIFDQAIAIVRRHPAPAAMIALGVLLLLLGPKRLPQLGNVPEP